MRILRACFTEGKITHGISPFKVRNLDSVAPIFVVVGSIVGPHQTSNLCNMTQPTNIRDAKKAFNQALYRPTAERKAEAVKLLQALITQVNEMEETKAKPKAKRVKRKSKAQKLEEAQARDNVSETYLPADKPKRKPSCSRLLQAYPQGARSRTWPSHTGRATTWRSNVMAAWMQSMGALSSKRMRRNPEMLKVLKYLQLGISCLNFVVESNINPQTHTPW